jgi:hypothetical protein
MPVDPAEPVVTAACVFCCRRAMGEAITRHSLRPRVFEGRWQCINPDAIASREYCCLFHSMSSPAKAGAPVSQRPLGEQRPSLDDIAFVVGHSGIRRVGKAKRAHHSRSKMPKGRWARCFAPLPTLRQFGYITGSAARTGCRRCSRAGSGRAGSSAWSPRRYYGRRLRRNCRHGG